MFGGLISIWVDDLNFMIFGFCCSYFRISICMVLLFQFPSLFFLILLFSISIQLCKYHLNVIFCWSWILALFCSSSFICSMCWFIMFMRFRCVSICRPCSKLEWLISLDEFDFSSMGSSVMLVSEFDPEAYGLSFKPFFLAL